jgi:ribosomal protein L22
MKADVDVRIKELEEESERSALAELDRRFRSERETMEVALALRRQEMALEQEVEMEHRVAEFAKKREGEMMAKLEEQFAKRGDLSKKEVKEILKSLEAVLKSKWEAALLDAKQSALERVGED